MTQIESIKNKGLAIIQKVENENRSLKESERLALDQLLRNADSLNNQKTKMKNPINVKSSVEKTEGLFQVGEERNQKNIFGQMAKALVSGHSESRAIELGGNGATVANNDVKPIIKELGAQLVLSKAGVPLIDGTGYNNHIWPVQTGNPTASFVAEGSQVSASDATFTGRTAGTHAIACEVRVSRQLLASTQDVDKAISASISRQVARGIESAAFSNTNVTNAFDALVNVAGVTDIYAGATNGTTLTNFDAYTDLKKALRAGDINDNVSYFMHSDLEAGFGSLKDLNNQPMGPSPYVFNEVYENTYVSSLFDTDLTKGSGTGLSNIIALDPSALRMVMKENLVMRLDERRSDFLEVVFLAVAMVDLIAVHPAAIKYAGGVKF